MAIPPVDSSQVGSDNTILVIASSTPDARALVHRLIGGERQSSATGRSGADNDEESDDGLVPWLIENKYYTAQVYFRLCELDELELWERGVEVVLYTFTGRAPNPLPAGLTKMMTSQPRDIALAIRTTSAVAAALSESEKESAEELFDELGMELVDEDQAPEDDDERPISPLEGVRQTLMTHMWPNMQRKPLGVRMPLAEDGDHDDGDEDEDELYITASGGRIGMGSADDDEPRGNQHEQHEPPASFEVDFAGGRQGEDSAALGAQGSDAAGASSRSAFPDVADLRSQIATANLSHLSKLGSLELSADKEDFSNFDSFRQLGRMGQLGSPNAQAGPSRSAGGAGLSNMISMLDRLEALDMAGAPDDLDDGDEDDEFMRGVEEQLALEEREYARLEEWLDADEDEGMDGFGTGPNGGFASLPDGNPTDDGVHGTGGYGHLVSAAGEDHIPNDCPPSGGESGTRQGGLAVQSDTQGFEDDFADFQSAPPIALPRTPRATRSTAAQRGDLRIPLDPTPLLLRLQSVRAELSGVEDEDERRVRAGREVERVMRDLGMSGDLASLGL